jgi:site-specific recombinase XerD
LQLAAAIDGFLSGYFSTCRRSQKTQTAYEIDLSQFRDYVGAAESLEGISVETVEAWAGELKARGYAPVSMRRKFATLRVFFAYWVRKSELAASPLWRVRLDLGRQQQLPRALSAVDAKRLLEIAWSRTAPPTEQIARPSDRRFLAVRNLVAVEILFATGMRVGELAALRLGDWRQDEATFLVKGKGLRQRVAMLPDERSICATTTYFKLRASFDVGHDGLLVNAAGGRLTTQGVSRILAALAAGASIERHVTPHMIRHTVATLLLRNGADIRVVQEVLGHASIVTTQRYTHISKEHLTATLRAHHPSSHLGVRREFGA